MKNVAIFDIHTPRPHTFSASSTQTATIVEIHYSNNKGPVNCDNFIFFIGLIIEVIFFFLNIFDEYVIIVKLKYVLIPSKTNFNTSR